MKSIAKIKQRVFLDTNIILDVLSSDNRNHREASRKIFQAMRNEDFEGFITTQSIIDAQYILSKEKGFWISKTMPSSSRQTPRMWMWW